MCILLVIVGSLKNLSELLSKIYVYSVPFGALAHQYKGRFRYMYFITVNLCSSVLNIVVVFFLDCCFKFTAVGSKNKRSSSFFSGNAAETRGTTQLGGRKDCLAGVP